MTESAKSVPRVLLLTGIPPGDGSVGELFLRELCKVYPPKRIFCFALRRFDVWKPSKELEWLAIKVESWDYKKWLHLFRGPLHKIFVPLAFLFNRLYREKRLIGRIQRFAKQNKIEMLWTVLNHPTIYHVARELSKKLSVPMVTTVWDPPEQIVNNFGLDFYSQRMALKDFDQVIHRSIRCGVISSLMRNEYESKYKTPSIVMRYGVGHEVNYRKKREPQGLREFVIGYAGSMYTRNEWEALLDALSSIGWSLDGKQVIVRVLGFGGSLNHREGPIHIEYLGWRSTPDVIRLLSTTDINYLPYWFDSEHEISVRLCFPTKLTTYLAAGRPILYHGPEESSVMEFLRQFPIGVSCHSLKGDAIIEVLTKFDIANCSHEKMIAAGQEAIRSELNHVRFLQQFADLIGIEINALNTSAT